MASVLFRPQCYKSYARARGGWGLVLFSDRSRWVLLNSYIETFKSTPYLAGVTAAQLQWHLTNMKLTFSLYKELQVNVFQPKGEINERSISTPHPRSNANTGPKLRPKFGHRCTCRYPSTWFSSQGADYRIGMLSPQFLMVQMISDDVFID